MSKSTCSSVKAGFSSGVAKKNEWSIDVLRGYSYIHTLFAV